jgi:hypothetical protein
LFEDVVQIVVGKVVVQMGLIVEDLTIILVRIQRTEGPVSTKTIGASD